MRNTAIAALLALSVSIVTSAQASEIGMGVLMIWPTARSTALAGAMTGLADEADATYFNPAGLAFQTTAKADIDFGNWLPGLWQGMIYATAAGGAPVRLPFLRGRNAFVAVSLAYMQVGETDVVNERGDFLGRVAIERGAVGVHAAATITPVLAAGASLKLLRSGYDLDPYGWLMHARPELGLENGGTTTGFAADIGLLCRPSSRISVGLSLANVGPRLSYRILWKGSEDYVADLPRMARLGLCWTPVESRYVRLSVMPELDKVLVGIFHDTTGTKTFSRMLGEELRDIWKAVGVEATAFGILSFRLSYFEDLTNQRGGLVYEKERWDTYHYGIGDVLAGRHLGKLKSLGLCWGLGFGTDKLRFDFSSDAAIYDFPTRNWKFQLVSNDIGGLIQRLRGS
jgi:hypothetical protein